MSEKKQRELRVRCLVLDHDDTVVKSTPEINFPAFLRSLKDLRGTTMSYEQFVEETEWERAAAVTIPAVYEGLPEILHTYMENGGKICVSSHSMRKTILRDYEAAGLPTPELIFDWACPEGKRKPHPYALQETMRILNLKPEELLMVDDLKPGYDMAKACGVPFACAGWSDNQIPVVREYMQKYCDYYLKTTAELEKILYKD